ncbi:MAG TPA: aminotransferase class I/II-fold pyridoxal phosphate-dependent enzyme [Caulobacteraceae bacterium]|jgi:cystathionine gamma-synthase/methionine-gamma-lyase|nr:aminotransferase class I/II-fold pyridoxal phosphate-dependent enzyme [Caulobacteraceae bacterium]
MAEDRGLHKETLAVGHGYEPASGGGAAKPPLYLTSTFVYASAQAAKDAHRVFFDGPGQGDDEAAAAHIYARLGHPNLDMVERRLAALDGAEAAAGFCSGMAAASTILLGHLRPGDVVLQSLPIYGGVDSLIGQVLSQFGVKAFHFADGLDGAAMRRAAEEAAAAGPVRMIWLETPANPTGAVVNIALAVEVAGELAARQGFRPLVAVDNTFLGPFLQSPLALGADLCMTSLTKYCGGHSDLLAGGVSGRAELIGPLRTLRTWLGNPMDAHTAWLLLRSFETLALRTARACDNALAVGRFLAAHPKVAGVTFIGLAEPGSREHDLMRRQTRGGGSTFSFRIQGGEAAAFRLLDALRLLRLAVSLGGSETLICHPASTTHYPIARDRLAEAGVTESTLRLSVGLEHPDDLIADLAQALERV